MEGIIFNNFMRSCKKRKQEFDDDLDGTGKIQEENLLHITTKQKKN